jgi:hypothetical protein
MNPIVRNNMPINSIKVGPPNPNNVELKRLINVMMSRIKNNINMNDVKTILNTFRTLDEPLSTKFTETLIITEITPKGNAIKYDKSPNSRPWA